MNDDIKRLDWISNTARDLARDSLDVRIQHTKEGYVIWIGRVPITAQPTLRIALDLAARVIA